MPSRGCESWTARSPVRDRKMGTFSRSYRFSANAQVIVDADSAWW
jgi:hypothetical protein